MIPLSLKEIAETTGGRLPPGSEDVVIYGPVDTDSRALGPGGLFVARVGEHEDGLRYAGAAARAGALACLAAAESPELANVLAKVGLARDMGIDKFSFYNYGFLTEERVRWLAAISKSFA